MSNCKCKHEQQIADLTDKVTALELNVNENFDQNYGQVSDKQKKKKAKRAASVELKPNDGPSHSIGSRLPFVMQKKTKEVSTILFSTRNVDVNNIHQLTDDEMNKLKNVPPQQWEPSLAKIMLSTYQNTQILAEKLTNIEDFLGIQGQDISDKHIMKPKKISSATQKNMQKFTLSKQLTQISNTLTQLSEKQEEFARKLGLFANDLNKLSITKGKKIDKLIDNTMKNIKAYKEEEEKKEKEEFVEEKEV